LRPEGEEKGRRLLHAKKSKTVGETRINWQRFNGRVAKVTNPRKKTTACSHKKRREKKEGRGGVQGKKQKGSYRALKKKGSPRK